MARTEWVVAYASPAHPGGHEFATRDRRQAEDFHRAAILSGWSPARAVPRCATCHGSRTVPETHDLGPGTPSYVEAVSCPGCGRG